MSFDRPGLDDDQYVSDTDVNEALENDRVDEGGLDVDQLEHEDGEPSAGPQPDERRPPANEDVTAGDQGQPIEPPD